MTPRIRFLVNPRGRRIAYVRFGQGPLLVVPPGWISHFELQWQEPAFAAFFSALAQHNTVVYFDRQGTGLSDRERTDFSLDADLADLEAVVAEQAPPELSLFAFSQGGPMAVAYAARHPETVKRLLLYGTYADGTALGHPAGRQALLELVRASWGMGARSLASLFIPDPSSAPAAASWLGRLQRECSSAEMAARMLEAMYRTDVTALLPRVAAPTLVIHRRGDRAIAPRLGRELAAGLPDARLALLEGDIHLAWLGNSAEVLRLIAEFLDQPPPVLAEPANETRAYQVIHYDLLGAAGELPASSCRVGVAQLDLRPDDLEEKRSRLFGLKADRVARVASELRHMLERATERRVDLLLLPELSVDLSVPELLGLVQGWARRTGGYVAPGSFHDLSAGANLCRVLGPGGPLWEQRKHLPADLRLGSARVVEGIGPGSRRVIVADTRLGRIVVVICRDFLDLDLRVALKNFDPPVDIVLNPAFTPVTRDFEAAHFEARRSLYAYSCFCNTAAFGHSLIHSPEKHARRRGLVAGREGLVVKDVDLVALRAARQAWADRRAREQARFIQSTR